MATDSRSVTASAANAAGVRTWYQAIDAALLAAGLTAASDTGQVDLTTIAITGGPDAYYGYKIYRFADSLQATAPVFIRVDFGAGAWPSSAPNPAIKVTVGTATNGAGTLSGQVGTAHVLSGLTSADQSGSTARTMLTSGSTNRVAQCLPVRGTATEDADAYATWGVERSRSDDGTEGNDIVFFCRTPYLGARTTAGSRRHQYIPRTGTVAAVKQGSSAVAPGASSSTSNVLGTEVGIYPLPPLSNKNNNPALNFNAYLDGDITIDAQVTISVYGTNHTYYALGTRSGSEALSPESVALNANARLLMLWE